MQNAGTVVLSVVVSLGAAFALVKVTGPGAPPAAPAPQSDSTAVIESLRGQVEALSQRLEALDGRLGPTEPTAAARSETAQSRSAAIEAVVQRVLEERGVLGAGRPAEAAATVAINIDDAVAQLIEEGLMTNDANEIWRTLREAGQLDDAIDAFRRRARENLNSADAQADLGNALVQKIMSAKDYTEQGQLAIESDRAYDEALDIDPNHWGARLSKAVGYTFWPDFLGKKPEAIKHLDVLVGQQESGGQQKPEYEQTYLILGNLYEGQGNADKAREVWQRGLGLFPGSAQLKGKLAPK